MRPERLPILLVLLLALLAGCASSGGTKPSAVTSDAEDAARVHTELGQQYMKHGDLKGALGKLQMALQFDPDYAPAHTVLGVLYERIGDLPNAELHKRRAVALEPKDGATNTNLAVFLCQQDKVAEAAGYFKRAEADPFYATPDIAWTNAGTCVLKNKDYKQAEQDYRKALAINPKNADALYQLAYILYQQNDAFRARAFVQRFEALGVPSAAALKLGHDIEIRLGDVEGAQDYARRLRATFPDSEQAHALDPSRSP
jgi:type IV pilus assembly protein PilF